MAKRGSRKALQVHVDMAGYRLRLSAKPAPRLSALEILNIVISVYVLFLAIYDTNKKLEASPNK